MTWNYRIIHHDDPEHPWFGLHEVYYDENRRVETWTENPVGFVCEPEEGPENIAGALQMALADALKYPVLVESELVQQMNASKR